MRKLLSHVAKVLAVLAAVYALASAALYWVMHLPVDRFSAVMARMPGPAFAVLPFVPLWNSARAGDLALGDMAPDFELAAPDETSRFRLSSLRGQQPVVLVFGSYT